MGGQQEVVGVQAQVKGLRLLFVNEGLVFQLGKEVALQVLCHQLILHVIFSKGS
jgi:hypothetical protein